MNKNDLQSRIRVIKAANNALTLSELADIIGIAYYRLNSFMNNRIKKYDDIESAINMHFPEARKQDKRSVTGDELQESSDFVSKSYEQICDKIKQLEIEIEALNLKLDRYDETWGERLNLKVLRH